MVDVDKLSDNELRMKLQEFGFPVMPITGTTRKVMAKKLKMLLENKSKLGNEGGRRSLGRYSSEEESDTETKSAKKKDNRRATMAAPLMQPPAVSNVRSRKNTRINESPEPEIRTSPVKRDVRSTSTTTVTSRSQKILNSAQDDFDTGSDSESDIVSNNYNNSPSSDYTRNSPVKPNSNISYNSRRYSPPKTVESSYSSTRNLSLNNAGSPSRLSTYNSPSLASEYASERLNQIRSRLSLGSPSYERPTSYTSTPVEKEETPFLSNFTRKLSTLSSTARNEPDYKNDIIKEHDTNGSSQYARTQHAIGFRAPRGRETTTLEKINQNNILKNNFVSFAVLGGAGLFFIFLAIMYMGMKSDTSVIPAGSTIPRCFKDIPSSKRTVNCIDGNDVGDAINLLNVLKPELQKRAIANRCFDATIKAHMTESEIINFCLTNFAIQQGERIKRDLNNLEILIFHNPEWGLSVVQTENNNGLVSEEDKANNMEQVIFNRGHKLTSLIEFNPELPWKCAFYQTFHVTFKGFIIVALIFVVLYLLNLALKYYKRHVQKEKDEIGFMVERIIDILQTNAGEDGRDNFIVINHVRDMILPVKDRKRKEKTWIKAVKFINENESRIRTEVQEVQGEPFEVWRWIGSANLSMSGDRSDYKYRRGRRIVDAQYLIEEVLKFPHKRLRFCKNSDIEIKNEIREGFLSVFLLCCKSCKREHPVCTEDPDWELMNVNLAFVAGAVSLGMSLYHLNEICSSLHIPTISGKNYNVYLDEIFEIYNKSISDSEKSRDETFTKSQKEINEAAESEQKNIDTLLKDMKYETFKEESKKLSSTPNVSKNLENEYESKEKAFLESLKKSHLEIQELADTTIDQRNNSLWHSERKKRITASNFGRIVKLRPTTNRKQIVEGLLNSTFFGNCHTRYGIENESNAIASFEKISGLKIDRCGFFVHPEYPYLGASPDGLIGDDAIIEIKCPSKAKDYTPEDAIRLDLIKCATYENGQLTLKRNDNYYFQVQGQLFVTGRDYCYFIIWTAQGLLYEKIARDEQCWNDMLPKMEEFYFQYMLPKLLSEYN